MGDTICEVASDRYSTIHNATQHTQLYRTIHDDAHYNIHTMHFIVLLHSVWHSIALHCAAAACCIALLALHCAAMAQLQKSVGEWLQDAGHLAPSSVGK